MSEAVFQQAYARLLTDAAFRQAVIEGEADAAGAWGYDAGILERLRGLDRERSALFANLLCGMRMSKVMEALPRTMSLMGRDLPALFAEYHQAVPSVNAKKYPEAMACARYLLGKLEEVALGPPCLHDVLLYEMSSLELRHEFDGALSPYAVDDPAALLERLDVPGAAIYLHRHRHQRILALSYDVEWICDEMDAGRDPTAAEPSPVMLLLCANPDGSLEQLAINAETASFVSESDGTRRFDEVVARLAELYHQDTLAQRMALRSSCVGLCRELVAHGVIGVAERPTEPLLS